MDLNILYVISRTSKIVIPLIYDNVYSLLVKSSNFATFYMPFMI